MLCTGKRVLEGDTAVCSVGCDGACSGCLWMSTFRGYVAVTVRGDVAETVRGDVVVFWLFVEMNLFSSFLWRSSGREDVPRRSGEKCCDCFSFRGEL